MYSVLYIKSAERETVNMLVMNSCRLFTDSIYIMHYSLNGENETVLYRQGFAIYRCLLRQI